LKNYNLESFNNNIEEENFDLRKRKMRESTTGHRKLIVLGEYLNSIVNLIEIPI